MPNTYLNLAAYQFADLDDLPGLRAHLLAEGRRLDMRGTILLTPEGINIMLSGPTDNARAFADVLRSLPPLANMHIKESLSNEQSFNRFLVKIKRETITFRQPGIRPADGRAAAVSPETLARWIDEGHDDDGRDIAIIDTRNDFEVQVGHFHGAINPHITKFTELPAALEAHRPNWPASVSSPTAQAASAARRQPSGWPPTATTMSSSLTAACWTTSSTPVANTGTANSSSLIAVSPSPPIWPLAPGNRTSTPEPSIPHRSTTPPPSPPAREADRLPARLPAGAIAPIS